MTTVTMMPGVYRPDLEEPTEPENCLASAMNEGLRDVAIVGRTTAGNILVWCSKADADAAIGMFHQGIALMAGAHQVRVSEAEPSDNLA